MALRATKVDGSAESALDLTRELGEIALPGRGDTVTRWELLASLGAADLTAARVAEAHLDALAILAEAGMGNDALPDLRADNSSTWGVFAAEGPGVRVLATPGPDATWVLNGIKPWCSLAGRLSHALITAHTENGRRLFAIELQAGSVEQQANTWFSRGLSEVDSGAITLTDAVAVPVGADGWYLERAGFAWGGMGVAACWYGGAVGLGRTLFTNAAARMAAGKEPDQIALMHLGAVDIAITAARAVLAAGAAAVDGGQADGPAGVIWAARIRGQVATAAESVLTRVGHSLGPAPLALDAEHARRVADLEIYLRQHHAERDDAGLGRDLLSGASSGGASTAASPSVPSSSAVQPW